MQKDIFHKIIDFLLGASWAFVFFGALVTFKLFLFSGILLSLFFTFIFIFLSLFLILLLDAFIVHKERLYETKKQTELLEKLLEENN